MNTFKSSKLERLLLHPFFYLPIQHPVQATLRLATGVALTLCLLPTLAAYANNNEDKARSSGRSSGSRGCGVATAPLTQGTIPALILLAPSNQTGQTSSTRPTFAWFVRDGADVPLEFRLYEQGEQGFKLVQELKGDRLKSSPGIMVLANHPSIPELTVGKRYRWQVELVCNANRPAGNPFAEAEIEVVALQSTLKHQLLQTRDLLDQAQLYKQANLWYDLLHTALDPVNRFTAITEVQSLLFKQVALNTAEQTVLKNSKILPILP
jgi:Domain of Unknown Function (DUF928)